MTRTALERLVYIVPVTCIVALFAIFQLSDPISIGPGGILIVFILLYLFVASCLFIILHFGIGIAGRVLRRRNSLQQREWSIGIRKSYYIASIVAFAPVCLLAMQSLGQLRVRDFMLVLALSVVMIFYVMKRD